MNNAPLQIPCDLAAGYQARATTFCQLLVMERHGERRLLSPIGQAGFRHQLRGSNPRPAVQRHNVVQRANLAGRPAWSDPGLL